MTVARSPIPADLARPADAPDDEAVDLFLDPPENTVVGGRWSIDDDGAAEWAMRKLAAIEAKAQEAEAKAQAWAEDIGRWLEGEVAPLQRRHAYFEGLLIDYQRRRREADPKAKTLRLPSGAVSSTYHQAKAVVAREDEYAAWALTLWREGGPLLFRPKPAVTALRAAADVKLGVGVFVDAERVPGVIIEPERVSYSVKAGS